MKTKSSKCVLSICLIVKNEAEMLPECLESVKGLADQIVVVDTGSTDETIAIARSFGAEIHHFQWCDDFSAARNASIQHAIGDWILWLDADERLTHESRSELLALLKFEKTPVIYRLRIKNLKEDGINFYLSDAHRLFTNHRGIKFSGKIHEQISPSAKIMRAQERWSSVTLDHLGYSFTDDRKSRKQERNRTLLLDEVRNNPKNAYAQFTLGHNYKVDGDLANARNHYEEAIRLKQFDPGMEASLLNTYAETLLELQEFDAIPGLIHKSLKLKHLQNAAYYLQYRLAHAQGNISSAITALQKLKSIQVKVLKQGTSISNDIEISESVIDQTLGDLYGAAEEWSQAAAAYNRALKTGGDKTPILNRYFKVVERIEDWDTAIDLLGRLMHLEGEQPIYLNALGMILLRGSRFEEALAVFLRLDAVQPGTPDVRRKVASLYAKLGNMEEAQLWLS